MKCCETTSALVSSTTTSSLPGNNTPMLLTRDAESFKGPLANSYLFFVPELKCAACLKLVTSVLSKIEFIDDVQIDLSEKTITVFFSRQQPSFSEIASALVEAGYSVLPPIRIGDAKTQQMLSRKRLKQLGIAGAAFGNVMLLSAALYLAHDSGNIDPATQRLFLWLSAALTVGSLWMTARSLFQNAWNALRFKKLHVDAPILFAMLVALAVSLLHLLQGSDDVYFDSITGLLFFLLAGRTLHDSLLERAKKLTHVAPSALPRRAAHVKLAENIHVLAGETFPADAIVTNGLSEVDESLLTGESLLVTKKPGDTVYAGTHNRLGALDCRVTACQEDTRLWKILKATEQAAQNKAVYQNIIDQILPWFVFCTLLLASLGFAIWVAHDAVFAVKVFVTVLIVCCPCALALALPLASTFSLRRAWQHGALIKSPDTMERLAVADTLVIDKTRTLTTGDVRVTQLIGHPSAAFKKRLLATAQKSHHPVSRAVVEFFSERTPPTTDETHHHHVCEFPGSGITGTFADGETLYLGKKEWIRQQLSERGALDFLQIQTLLKCDDDGVYATDGICVCAFLLTDPVRAEASRVVSLWQKAGLAVYIASGDAQARAQRTGREVGVPASHIHGDLSPEDKLRFVKSLQAENRRVLFVGDGLNDMGAASQANVSVAVGGSLDLTIVHSDVAMEKSNLLHIEQLRLFSIYSLKTLKLILTVSALYNVIAVCVSLAGLLHPLVAALIMPAASISILLISLVRKGDHLWTSSYLSSPFPSPLPPQPLTRFGVQPTPGSGMTSKPLLKKS